MSHALSIQPKAPATGIGESTAPARANVPARPVPAKPVQPFNNPDLRLDPALGLVVIEFHDDAGKLTSSIPNQRQIDAYRMHEATPPGQKAPTAKDDTTPVG